MLGRGARDLDRGLAWTVWTVDPSDVAPSDLPKMRVVELNGHLYSLDNHRLLVFKQFGHPVRVRVQALVALES